MSNLDPNSFDNFGDLLKHLRRRARLTQRELGLAVGYSEAHIARLESSQRNPNPTAVRADFIEALFLKREPEWAARLLALAGSKANSYALYPDETQTHAPTNLLPPTNLREQLTHFVGRATELAEVKPLLGYSRLLTLLGAPGVGKTRIAAHLAAHSLAVYPDGVWLVPFAGVTETTLLPKTMTQTLGLAANENDIAALRAYLREREALLVLDNCEHHIRACAELVVTLLQSCPHLTILATSREPLNVPSEITWHVTPMTSDDAVQLFMERAHTARPDITLTNRNLIQNICHQLDHVPLCIELATGRLDTLSLEQITERADDRFHLLTGGSRLALPKHQSLLASLQWSYDLLLPREQVLLQRLSVFAKAFSLDEAETAGADQTQPKDKTLSIRRKDILDLVTALVRKSLVERDEDTDAQPYRLLQMVRQFAQQQSR